MRGQAERIVELYSEGGLSEVHRGVRDYIYYRNPFRKRDDYEEIRSDNNKRWEYISSYVEDNTSLIDIGCAEGYFTRKAASSGIFSVGIESSETRVLRARQRADSMDNCGFIRMEVGPQNIENLPEFDVFLLMTVHHHWEDLYGLDASEEMFEQVLSKCGLLIYEPPGDRPIIKQQKGSINPEQSLIFHKSRLQALYNNIDIISAKKFAHVKDNNRKDPVFIMDCSSYD